MIMFPIIGVVRLEIDRGNKMNAFILLIPFLLIAFINEGAIKRAGYFAPLQGNEKIAYVIYQMANIGIFIYFFLLVIIDLSWQFCLGLLVYLLGLGMCIVLVKDFFSNK